MNLFKRKGSLKFTKMTLTLIPLAPIHVWSGNDAVLGIDAVIRPDGKLCIVDLEQLTPDIAEALAKTSPQQLFQKIKEYVEKLPCKNVVPVYTTLEENSRIKLLSSQIVPGSSLKGYIRTALAYYILSTMKKEAAKSLLRGGIDLSEKPQKISQGLEGGLFRKPRPKTQGGFVDMLQGLLISDPQPEDVKLGVVNLMTYEIIDREIKEIATVNAVALLKGTLKYDLLIETIHDVSFSDKPYLRPKRISSKEVHKIISDLKSDIEKLGVLSKDIIKHALMKFGCSIVENELSRVKEIAKLNGYRKFLEDIKKKYCEKAYGKCAIARIGFMTGHRAKTILSLVEKLDPKLYGNIRNIMEMYFGKTWNLRTLKLVRINKEFRGIGWCELCLEN